MTKCYVCSTSIAAPAYEKLAPAITSIMTTLDIPTRVFICETCGHAQSSEIPDIEAFYDTGYRISLNSDTHDQIVAVQPDGKIIYRTDHQADIALRMMNLRQGSALLDYGAAKADTLRKLCAVRPDINAYVFDVSTDYSAAWQGWVSPENQATYSIPDDWKQRFDAVMSHFVIEHVIDPVGFIGTIAGLLKPGGTLLLSMPNVSANPGDMVVADHVNHFSATSLEQALINAGFTLKSLDSTSFPGAYFAVATLETPTGKPDGAEIGTAVARAQEICADWQKVSASVETAISNLQGEKVAIYGAGFYGSWLFHLISQRAKPALFLDRNPHLQGSTHLGLPVVLPEEIPDDIDVLFIGLNPLKARSAVEAQPWLMRDGLRHVWLDGV